MTQTQEPKTVKFEAISGLTEAKIALSRAIAYLEIVRDLGGDNEADLIAESILVEIEAQKQRLEQSIAEANAFW